MWFWGKSINIAPQTLLLWLGCMLTGLDQVKWPISTLFSHYKSLPPESTDWIVAWLPTKTYRTLMNCPPWANVCIGHMHKSIFSGLVIYNLWIRLVWVLGMAIKTHKGENVQNNHFFMAYVHIQLSNLELLWGWCCLERGLGWRWSQAKDIY